MAGVHLCAGRESGVFVLADDCFGSGSGGGTVWDREIPYPAPVSYTHLDVYKRQRYKSIQKGSPGCAGGSFLY